MRSYWKMVKEIPFSAGFTAKFYTLMVDTRDARCDSVRPEYAVADCALNHRVEVVDDIRRFAVFGRDVSKDEGNAMYREMKPLDHYGYGRAECMDWLRRNGANI